MYLHFPYFQYGEFIVKIQVFETSLIIILYTTFEIIRLMKSVRRIYENLRYNVERCYVRVLTYNCSTRVILCDHCKSRRNRSLKGYNNIIEPENSRATRPHTLS